MDLCVSTVESAIVSKTIGEGENEKANKYFSMIIYFEMILDTLFVYVFRFGVKGASSFFTALNDGLTSAIISFLRTLVFQIIMILLLSSIFGINGIWVSVVVAELLALVVSIFYLVKKRKIYNYA